MRREPGLIGLSFPLLQMQPKTMEAILSIHKYHYSHYIPSFPEVFTIVDPFIRCTTKDIRKRYSRKDSVFVTLPLPRSPRTVGRRLKINYNRSVSLGAHEVRPAPSTFTQMFERPIGTSLINEIQ